ncbi:MAG: HIT domain-containing protein [Microbacteriaceae bacterium]|nr:HIT domain-containing protein [Microbacteriaceae bacterium]
MNVAENPVPENSGDFAAGAPDGFGRLWTPHRLVYIKDHEQADEHNCPFCAAPPKSDEAGLIVARGTHAFALLNLYPYNGGHLMVCPYRHIGTYDLANREEVQEIGEMTQQAMHVLKVASRCHGFNIGMNQGEVAGAGVAAHLHQHIVPRWSNDANFFPIIARTKAMPQLLSEVRETIASAWEAEFPANSR